MLAKARAAWAAATTVAGSNYFLYLLPSVLQGGVGLLLVPLTTYYLEPSDFGIFALIGALAMPVRAVAATGARWVIGGNYFQVPEDERRAMLFNVLFAEMVLRSALIAVLATCAESILRLAIADYRPAHLGYFYLTLAAAWAGSLWSAISFLMTLQDRPRPFALFSSLQVAVNALTVVMGLAVVGLGVEALFLGALVAGLVSLALEIIYARGFLAVRVDGRWLREIARTGLRATPGGMADLVAGIAEKLLIQRWAGLAALGLYSHSQQYQSIFKMLTGAFNNTLTPASLRAYSGQGEDGAQERMLSLWYGLLGVAGVAVALFADEAIGFLTHGKFLGSAPLVPIWYLMVFGLSHGSPYACFLMAHKRNRALMHTQFLPTVLGVGLVAFGAYHYGIFGAAWALVATNVLIQVARRIVAGRLGYRGVAERRFAEALGSYLVLWGLDSQLGWSVVTELAVAALAAPALSARFGLLASLRRTVGGYGGGRP